MSFRTRLASVTAQAGTLCVGIDPHASLLAAWGLPDSATGARDFGLRVVEAAQGRVGIVKPQVAFFERHGAAGFAALEEVLAATRAADLFVIADAKRGDVGPTADAYGDAWLRPGSPLEVDAMTAAAAQGLGSLDGVFRLATEHGKGVIVVAVASNPEAAATQGATRSDGRTVSAALVDEVGARGSPILAPGFGAQGARIADLRRVFGPAAPGVIVSISRGILHAGPREIVAAIDASAAEVATCLR
jgi:orotidine-5'-phosphate decarboxylase